MKVILYHNPKCSKSRQALALLQENGVQPEIIEYLKTPPNVAQLKDLTAKLGLEPKNIMRPVEAKEAGTHHLDGEFLLAALAENPQALQRPIAVRGDKAVIGRPPENVLTLLSSQ